MRVFKPLGGGGGDLEFGPKKIRKRLETRCLIPKGRVTSFQGEGEW